MKAIRPFAPALQRPAARRQPSICRALQQTSDLATRATTHRSLHTSNAFPTLKKPELQQHRTFFGSATTNPFGSNQTLTAQRTLHYPSSVIYKIISDVSSYSQFLPFCKGSIVTKYSSPASDGKTYPEEAKLIIGFNDTIQEEFVSRVYCVPERVVEAVSGNMTSTLSGDQIAHHSPRPAADQDPSRKDTVMASLLTRWTLKPYPYKPPPVDATHPAKAHKNVQETNPVPGQEKTEVNLAIEFQFSNPLYAAVSGAAAPKVAEKMIEAFEQRVAEVMRGPGHAREKKAKTL